MGEIADMMLDGTLCCECGAYIGSDCDYPIKCEDCKKEDKHDKRNKRNIR